MVLEAITAAATTTTTATAGVAVVVVGSSSSNSSTAPNPIQSKTSDHNKRNDPGPTFYMLVEEVEHLFQELVDPGGQCPWMGHVADFTVLGSLAFGKGSSGCS